MTKLEQVALAIGNRLWRDAKGECLLIATDEQCRDIARMAVEALREPGERMLDVKHLLGTTNRGAAVYHERGDLEEIWQAMIDAILNEVAE